MIHIIKFINKLSKPTTKGGNVGGSVDEQQIAIDCAAVKCITSLISIKSISNDHESVEKVLLLIASRGAHLNEFTEELFISYLLKNKNRFSSILHYCISTSPSITEKPGDLSEYLLCKPLLESILSILRDHANYMDFSDFIFRFFFTTLFFQCSFHLEVRTLAIELANIISGRFANRLKSLSQVPSLRRGSIRQAHLAHSALSDSTQGIDSPKSPKPSGGASIVGGDSYLNLKLDKIVHLDPEEYLPCASHIDREIYTSIALKYSSELAKKYEKYTRDILREFTEFTGSLKSTTDITLMISLIKPWSNNYYSNSQSNLSSSESPAAVTNPSRWIIRALFEFSYVYVKNEGLTEALQKLWEDFIIENHSISTVKSAFEFLLEFTAKKLREKTIDNDIVKVSSLAILSIIRTSTTTLSAHSSSSPDQISHFIFDYLFGKLRNYPELPFFNASNPLENGLDIKNHFSQWFSESIGEFHEQINLENEKIAFLFLIPLVFGEIKFSYLFTDENLSLILHHAFLLNNFNSIPSSSSSFSASSSSSCSFALPSGPGLFFSSFLSHYFLFSPLHPSTPLPSFLRLLPFSLSSLLFIFYFLVPVFPPLVLSYSSPPFPSLVFTYSISLSLLRCLYSPSSSCFHPLPPLSPSYLPLPFLPSIPPSLPLLFEASCFPLYFFPLTKYSNVPLYYKGVIFPLISKSFPTNWVSFCQFISFHCQAICYYKYVL